jgi:HSP20 family protein
MANDLTRWDPINDFQSLRTAMDRLQRLSRLSSGDDEVGIRSLSLDVVETNDEYLVRAAIPGVDPKDVDINVNEDVLTISGKFEHKQEEKEEQYLRRELSYGEFHRSLRLPPTLDVDKASARFENGVLELRLPKRPEARARSLKITPQGVIEAGSDAEKDG